VTSSNIISTHFFRQFRGGVYQSIRENFEKLPIKSIVFVMQKTIIYEKSTQGRKKTTSELNDDINSIIDQIIKKYGKNK
jgi:hypothetical protein